MKTKNMVISALLIALGIIIPAVSISIIPDPPVSATLAAHVPVMVAMFISPAISVITAIGTTIGFVLKGFPFIVAMRAFVHIIFALAGSLLLKNTKGKPLSAIWPTIMITFVVTALLHTVSELAAIYLIAPDPVHMTVGAGIFMLHHTIDFAIALAVVSTLKGVKGIDIF